MKTKHTIWLFGVFGISVATWLVLRMNVSHIEKTMEVIARIAVEHELPDLLEDSYKKTGHYPITDAGMAMISNQTNPKLSNPKTDPWGRPYQYQFPASQSAKPYDVWSLGPKEYDSSDDIRNWK